MKATQCSMPPDCTRFPDSNRLIRPPLETCAPLSWFPILRPLPADGMMLPPDKEAAWMSPNGNVAIGAGLLA